MTLLPTTKLEAINELLDAISEAPVNALSGTGLLEADLAVTRLDNTSRQVQKRGWHWNTLKNYLIDPDSDGYIQLPTATLKVDTTGKDAHLDYVQKGSRLYDRKNNTFVISKSIRVEIVLFLDFEDLPEAARDYITMRAARKFQQRLFGNTDQSQFDREDEQQAWFDMLEAEADAADYNMLTSNLSVFRIINRKYFNKE